MGARLLHDPYAAVRLVAYRSLALLGYRIDYNFTGKPQHRSDATRKIVTQWRRRPSEIDHRLYRRVLFDADGRLRDDLVERLLGQRDDQLVTIHE